jgi:hypothetical protein
MSHPTQVTSTGYPIVKKHQDDVHASGDVKNYWGEWVDGCDAVLSAETGKLTVNLPMKCLNLEIDLSDVMRGGRAP